MTVSHLLTCLLIIHLYHSGTALTVQLTLSSMSLQLRVEENPEACRALLPREGGGSERFLRHPGGCGGQLPGETIGPPALYSSWLMSLVSPALGRMP